MAGRRHNQFGFTILESVLVIMIFALVGGGLMQFMKRPVTSFVLAAEQGTAAGKAQQAVLRISRELRTALPNSVRVKPSSSLALEFVPILDSARYRETSGAGSETANEILDFNANDAAWEVTGSFSAAALAATASDLRVVIYSQGSYSGTTDSPTAGLNVYNSNGSAGPFPVAGSHIITPAGTTVTLTDDGNEDKVTLSASHRFALSSPGQRMYLIRESNAPVSYICDLSSNQLMRYAGYTFTATQPTDPGAAPLNAAASAAIVADNVTDCDFEFDPGTAHRAAIVTIRLTFTPDNAGNSYELIRQVRVVNAP